jgi:8-oxo-dGTP diphosphatase
MVDNVEGVAVALIYTICFCRRGDAILMLYRNKPPNARRWNGLGGKIELGETPPACVRREVAEEAGIDLCLARRVRFAGLVTWASGVDPTAPSTGMYAYVAELPDDWPAWDGDRPTPDGLVAWKPLEWVCDPGNGAVVDNIPHVLPQLLARTEPMEYRCNYADERLVEVVARPVTVDALTSG